MLRVQLNDIAKKTQMVKILFLFYTFVVIQTIFLFVALFQVLIKEVKVEL